jgi:hypothetical protein
MEYAFLVKDLDEEFSQIGYIANELLSATNESRTVILNQYKDFINQNCNEIKNAIIKLGSCRGISSENIELANSYLSKSNEIIEFQL